MRTVNRFEDLECWQEARKLVNMVYKAVNENKYFQNVQRNIRPRVKTN